MISAGDLAPGILFGNKIFVMRLPILLRMIKDLIEYAEYAIRTKLRKQCRSSRCEQTITINFFRDM